MSRAGQLINFDAGSSPVQVRLEGESIWPTQRQMAEVFATTQENALMHLKNIFRDGELEEAATTQDFLAVQTEGRRQVQRRLKHYNFNAIISVGYRVNSSRATRFRQWATRVLREHLTAKAVHLLYFVIKNHPFADGNKRSGAFLFVDFLARNGRLLRDGQPVINDVGLAALALLVAESDAKNKDVMIRLIENMLALPAQGEG